MTASVSIHQKFAAAPAATIATATLAERPRAGDKTIRLGRLLPETARAAESMYAFLYFTRDGDGGRTVYYAPPDALVHADARLCRTRDSQEAVLALAKVCGGSGEGAKTGSGDGYPESVPMDGDDDGFDSAGLYLDRIVGTDHDEYEDATCDERAAAAERLAKDVGGAVYTQVDADGGGGGISYEKGLHLVNRTGVYAVVRSMCGTSTDGSADDALAGVVGMAGLMAHRSRPDGAAELVDRAAKSVAEAEYEAREGGCIDALPDMLSGARTDLVQAAAEYRRLAESAEAAAATAHRAWIGTAAALKGRCPVRAALVASVGDEEYIDEWYDLSADERDELCETGGDTDMYTDGYRKRLAEYGKKAMAHDAECGHGDCRASPASSSAERPVYHRCCLARECGHSSSSDDDDGAAGSALRDGGTVGL